MRYIYIYILYVGNITFSFMIQLTQRSLHATQHPLQMAPHCSMWLHHCSQANQVDLVYVGCKIVGGNMLKEGGRRKEEWVARKTNFLQTRREGGNFWKAAGCCEEEDMHPWRLEKLCLPRRSSVALPPCRSMMLPLLFGALVTKPWSPLPPCCSVTGVEANNQSCEVAENFAEVRSWGVVAAARSYRRHEALLRSYLQLGVPSCR